MFEPVDCLFTTLFFNKVCRHKQISLVLVFSGRCVSILAEVWAFSPRRCAVITVLPSSFVLRSKQRSPSGLSSSIFASLLTQRWDMKSRVSPGRHSPVSTFTSAFALLGTSRTIHVSKLFNRILTMCSGYK